MKPDLEVVQIGRAESFKAWEHGYPFRAVQWHFHPECELHYLVNASGSCFIGSFEPGMPEKTVAAATEQAQKERASGNIELR